MPELPEVEILVRHLRPLLANRSIRRIEVRRSRVVRPTTSRALSRSLRGASFKSLERRGKYLLFHLLKPGGETLKLLGHLGMTGRMFLLPHGAPLPKHAAVVLELDEARFVFEDTRYFGRFTLDLASLEKLGMEPLGSDFSAERFADALWNSAQPIKVKLLDQSIVAGVGNIYACEALFRAGILPTLPAKKLKAPQWQKLAQAIREVLTAAIERGSSIPLSYDGEGATDRLFYFGQAAGTDQTYEERFMVYDRAGQPCRVCGTPIKRIIQAARSTFYCPACQR